MVLFQIFQRRKRHLAQFLLFSEKNKHIIHSTYRISGGLGRFFSGLGRAGPIFYPKKSAQAGLGPYCILQKPAQAKMGQVKSGLGQNGPNFLAVIVPKWADFVSFLDQNGEVKIIMSLILHLDTGKIQNTYYEIHF